jgi:hypothetical protein
MGYNILLALFGSISLEYSKPPATPACVSSVEDES